MSSDLAPAHPVSFSLVVLPNTEDASNRGAIVRGFLGCPELRVEQVEGDEAAADSRMRIQIERRVPRRYPCSGCAGDTSGRRGIAVGLRLTSRGPRTP
jgi:hypothetical protein